jgi:hypothetical protein
MTSSSARERSIPGVCAAGSISDRGPSSNRDPKRYAFPLARRRRSAIASDETIEMILTRGRMASIENRMTNLESKFDTRFALLLSKVVEIDNRLIRLEAQRH